MSAEETERLIVRAAQALAMGASREEVVNSLREEGLSVEEAHLAVRAGELYLQMGIPEIPDEEEDMEDNPPETGSVVTENAAKKRTVGGKYYVFETPRGAKPVLVSRGALPLGNAKTFARIGATYGKHDRVVTTNPKAKDFRIVAKYKSGSGKKVRVR